MSCGNYVMDVNVNSTFRMVREALPLLKDHEGRAANIVIVASVGGVFGSTAGTAYITSKTCSSWTYEKSGMDL